MSPPTPPPPESTPDRATGAPFKETYVLEYSYKRSTGPVVGEFLGGLVEGQILGARTASGRVIVPPTEYDPDTGDELRNLVPVASTGAVVSWAWIEEPRPGQPLPHAFAWALIRLEGADTALLHAVDAGQASKMSTGMRVRVRWRAERIGEMGDIVCFDPEDAS